jgi:hypothetical protein
VARGAIRSSSVPGSPRSEIEAAPEAELLGLFGGGCCFLPPRRFAARGPAARGLADGGLAWPGSAHRPGFEAGHRRRSRLCGPRQLVVPLKAPAEGRRPRRSAGSRRRRSPPGARPSRGCPRAPPCSGVYFWLFSAFTFAPRAAARRLPSACEHRGVQGGRPSEPWPVRATVQGRCTKSSLPPPRSRRLFLLSRALTSAFASRSWRFRCRGWRRCVAASRRRSACSWGPMPQPSRSSAMSTLARGDVQRRQPIVRAGLGSAPL